MANNRFLGCRLRKEMDDDLFEAVKHLDGEAKSDLIRTGLRMALNIKTQKVVTVREIPVSAPAVWRPKVSK